MTQIEQIKAEIERRMREDYNTSESELDEVAQGVCAGILFFIESLEKEKEVDLEKLIRDWMSAMDEKFAILTHPPVDKVIVETARHFYELGKNS